MQKVKDFVTGQLQLRVPDGFTVFLLILGALSAYLVLLRGATHGIGMSWDSMTYIAGADKLLDGIFFTAYPAFFPPLFPIILASASLFIFEPRDIAGLVNATAFGLTVFVAGQWLRSRINSQFLVIWGCLAVAFSIPLTSATSMAWSEPVFILFSTLALIRTDRFLNTNQQSQLVWAALYTALACITRYAGVALIMTIALLLIIQPKVRLFESVKRVVAYLVISFTPLTLWLLRNLHLTGTLTGNRRPSTALFSETLGQVSEVVSTWAFPGFFTNRLETLVQKVFPYLPPGTFQIVVLILGGIGLLVLLIAAGYSLIRAYPDATAWNNWGPFYTFGTFALGYVSFMTAVWLIFHISPPSNRFLCPVYIPLLFVTVFALERMMRSEQEGRLLQTVNNWPIIRTIMPGRAKVLSVCLTIVLFLWLFQTALLNAAIIQQSKTGKYTGYASPKWAQSETIQYLQAHDFNGLLYSNITPAIYFNSACKNVLHLTLKVPPEIVSNAKGLHCFNLPHRWDKLLQRMKERNTALGDAYIVWFYDGPSRPGDDYDHQKIGSLPNTEPMVELLDGIIFRVTE